MPDESLTERVLICGDRLWTNFQLVLDELSKVQQASGVEIVIDGGDTGADTLGYLAAERLGIATQRYKPDWRKYGRNACSALNHQMLTEGRPTYVLAFHDYIENSKYTKEMVNIARAAGISVHVITERKK